MRKFLALSGLIASTGVVAVVAYMVLAAVIVCPTLDTTCIGTNAGDLIFQGDADTTVVSGLSGNDIINITDTGAPAVVNGDSGSDTIQGRGARGAGDTANGGLGNDFFDLVNIPVGGAALADVGTYNGQVGNDLFRSDSSDAQFLNGGPGNDVVDLNPATGGATGDISFGDSNGDGACTAVDDAAESGNDVVQDSAAGGANIFCMGSGNDKLTLRNDNTAEAVINLGSGNDTLIVNAGSAPAEEAIVCGTGVDIVIFQGGGTPATDFALAKGRYTGAAAFGIGIDDPINGGNYTNAAADCETVVVK